MDRRKKLKKQYKETPRPMGAYRVYNQEDRLSLIGTCKDVQARLNRHKTELKLGSHRNKAIQADWNRLGEEAFTFEIIELIEPLDDPDYNPDDDLEELMEIISAQDAYTPDKLYNNKK
ncbi:GIY-YIG nuclease family protein [Vibrio rhizosphaerae]|uniref:GIY-YIG nuclease family protein n=1 Tax=Vibrio rhizosphaerae TaxID=398736 RepID=UPI00056F0D5A|nr:GIY-YIG nuclease family protein [Vibrio rhizosphaerae]